MSTSEPERTTSNIPFPLSKGRHELAQLTVDSLDITSPSDASEEDGRLPRRQWFPQLILFLVTCLSTFVAGACHWIPAECFTSFAFLMQTLAENWQTGMIYTGCVLAILLTHEMGHFLAALVYGVPSSLPYFLPLPISPIGTLGAVIQMDGRKANRREIFDIGIAGPLAGLAVALPILWIGVVQLDLSTATHGSFALHNPLVVQWMLAIAQPAGYDASHAGITPVGQMNPFFMAGWVGLLITGLNMMPVSQLDGGHVLYGLWPRKAHMLARAFLLGAIALVVFYDALHWLLMLSIIVYIGVDHPPTSNDAMPLGLPRAWLGCVSWIIPWLCFPLHVVQQLN